MTRFEYKVVPAPAAGLKAKGLKTSEARFANALETLMNEIGADGWEYIRADTLPCEERSGLTGRVTKYQNMLVFRRALAPAAQEPQVAGLLEAPAARAEAPAKTAPAVPAPMPMPAAQGRDEPPFSRSMEDGNAGAAAARAAAAALRSYRTNPASPKSGTDLAAE